MKPQVTPRTGYDELPDHPTKKSKVLNLLAYVSLALVAIGIGVLLYWSFEGEDVLEVKNSPVPVRTIREHPTAEGIVILKTDFCKHTNKVGRVRTSFVSPSREVFLPVSYDKSEARCEVTELPILIPKDIPPGEYRVKFRISYNLNPIKNGIV